MSLTPDRRQPGTVGSRSVTRHSLAGSTDPDEKKATTIDPGIDIVVFGLGVLLIVFNKRIGGAMEGLNEAFWTKSALPLESVYRVMVVIFGAGLVFAAAKELWIPW